MAALFCEAVALISVEEDSWCSYNYVLTQLEVTDREIGDALSDALVQAGLATVKKWELNIWGNRDGSYWSAGEAGVLYRYIFLTERGKAWAAGLE